MIEDRHAPLAITHDGLHWRLQPPKNDLSWLVAFLAPVVAGGPWFALGGLAFAAALVVIRAQGWKKLRWELVADASGVSVHRANHPFSLRWSEIDAIRVVGTGLLVETSDRRHVCYAPGRWRAELYQVADWLEAARRAASEVIPDSAAPAELRRLVERSQSQPEVVETQPRSGGRGSAS